MKEIAIIPPLAMRIVVVELRGQSTAAREEGSMQKLVSKDNKV